MRAWRASALFGFLAWTSAVPACADDPAPSSSAARPGAPASGPGSTEPAAEAPSAATSPAPGGGGLQAPDDASVGEPADAAAPFRYAHYDVNHVLSTGQSNAVANDGKPILSTTQPYGNLMFDTGVIPASSCDTNGCSVYDEPTSFLPLVEGDRFFYPVETMSAGLANEVSKLGLARGIAHDMLVSLHGRSGNSYLCLRKGSCDWWPDKHYVRPFDDAMKEVASGQRIAAAGGKSYVVRAVTAIHGENDHYAYAADAPAFPMPGTDGVSTLRDYADALLEWQRDYQDGVVAITGQTEPVPLFVSQYSHWNNVPTSRIPYMQLDAHQRSAGKVTVVGPTYVLPYSSNCLHFTGEGERHLGEYFAKAYARTVLEGKRWEPLRPIRVTRSGNVVTAKFLVPSPPLVLDTALVKDPGHYGFEWFDESGSPPAITSVDLVAADTVQVTLAAVPTGPNPRLRYAFTFGGCAGSGTIARGNLRDSDPTPSQSGYELYNWAVHFDEPVL